MPTPPLALPRSPEIRKPQFANRVPRSLGQRAENGVLRVALQGTVSNHPFFKSPLIRPRESAGTATLRVGSVEVSDRRRGEFKTKFLTTRHFTVRVKIVTGSLCSWKKKAYTALLQRGTFLRREKTQRAQILKSFKIALRNCNFQARSKRMTFSSSEIENFKRATHKTLFLRGIPEGQD